MGLLHHKLGEVNLLDAAEIFVFGQYFVHLVTDLGSQVLAEVGFADVRFRGLTHHVQ